MRVAVDPPKQRAQLELERAVAFGATQPAGLLELRIQQAATRARNMPDALFIRLGHGVDHAGEKVRDLELVLPGRGLHPLFLGAALTHVDLRHLLVVDLREMDTRRILAADLAEHAFPQRDAGASRPLSSSRTRSANAASLSS